MLTLRTFSSLKRSYIYSTICNSLTITSRSARILQIGGKGVTLMSLLIATCQRLR